MKPADFLRPAAPLLLAAGFLTSALAPTVAATQTAAGYDGLYSVEVITDQGSCDKAYRWSVQVENGKVTTAANMPMEASGLIDHTGLVQLALRHNAQVAHIAGHMAGKFGSGTWSSPTMQCGGRWRAERVG